VKTHYVQANPHTLKGKLNDFYRNCGQQPTLSKENVLVVVLVQDSAKTLRESTKHWGDVTTGVPTQILVSGIFHWVAILMVEIENKQT